MSGLQDRATNVTTDETELICALRAGDEDVFMDLVGMYQHGMLHLAGLYVKDAAAAEEVVQETWLAVLQGLDRFEARSSLKTWIFRILVNRAKTRSQREARTVPFSALVDAQIEGDDPAVDPLRFHPPDAALYPGGWAAFPKPWDEVPKDRLLSKEVRQVVQGAIAVLPPAQREVMSLRDVEGWTAEEVCNTLGLSETNQRVLLHRARSKVRRALEIYLNAEKENVG